MTTVATGLICGLVSCVGGPNDRESALGRPLDPGALFRSVAGRVVVIETTQSQGSGVIVDDGVVLTNRHVVAGALAARIRQADKTWPVIDIELHPFEDLARLKAPAIVGPGKLRDRSWRSIGVGERVYAIGAPEGLELSMSEGIVSGIRTDRGVTYIQTTAAISPGSSGGGLFDQAGRLVGITTFVLRGGQNLNFALPIDLLEEWTPNLARGPAASPSAEFEPPKTAPVRIVEIDLGRAVDAQKRISDKTHIFKPDDTIYLSVATAGSSSGTRLAAHWMYKSQLVKHEETSIAPDGEAATEFHVSKPSGWPVGDYSVDVLLDGAFAGTKSFKVSR